MNSFNHEIEFIDETIVRFLESIERPVENKPLSDHRVKQARRIKELADKMTDFDKAKLFNIICVAIALTTQNNCACLSCLRRFTLNMGLDEAFLHENWQQGLHAKCTTEVNVRVRPRTAEETEDSYALVKGLFSAEASKVCTRFEDGIEYGDIDDE